MMTLSKKLQVFAIACSLALVPAISIAKVPMYYHYYYVYPDSMIWCGNLVEEVFKNTNKNWYFTKMKLTKAQQHFPLAMCVDFYDAAWLNNRAD